MKTIARNRTKLLADLQAKLTNCRVYDKASGEMVSIGPANAWHALNVNPKARLMEDTERERYMVHVHSNLFYYLSA